MLTTIREILEVHQLIWESDGDYGERNWTECSCSNHSFGDDYWTGDDESDHRAHAAEVLDKHMTEREAVALDNAADDSQMGPVPHGWNASGIASWLRARAEQIREAS